ncbi:hypothetical protein GM418_07245 [Maribellus comscasis]|uniref:Uroporphyrinogen decarboxylase (URO-D) domain-containing protein n=1 Tax=Maribellus comscasis TaxID=2681766 RepID=A0A6I6JM81_9BACT|nr:hypothetical protein [Maribellus comscasis]QGY43461.1 hypothetical protein GM418_07245 [Maribellus comscasis]
MLHDPSHIPQLPVEEEIILTQREKEILRRLGARIAEIALLPIQKEKARLWQKMNDLEQERPMVWINEIPWHEMNVNDELTLRTQHPWARELEQKLRREIYQWEHMPCDMVVNDYLDCPIVYHTTDFGIVEDVETKFTDSENDIYSRHFKIQISEPEDIEKIQLPVITYMEKATNYAFGAMKDIFEGIIPVKKQGQTHIWYTPWDFLIRWWGIEEAMLDLCMRPNMVHAAYDRMVDAWMYELDQFESKNLLSLDCNNTRIGSGGYGYANCLPGNKFNEEHVRPYNMWGCSNAQIFSSVSPEMHWEFALEHDMRWLKRFGLVYYGCCEPLDNKAEILACIPNLRKVSVSAWVNIKKAVEELGDKYVLSRKPSPSVFISWDPEEAKRQLVMFQDVAIGCNVEYIMKDISTVRYQPQRLWEWSELAMQIVGGA